jgi:predicted ribonuclease YlaK
MPKIYVLDTNVLLHDPESSFSRPNASINYLLSSEKIELEPLTYIRGRSIPRQFIICDESQNLSPPHKNHSEPHRQRQQDCVHR